MFGKEEVVQPGALIVFRLSDRSVMFQNLTHFDSICIDDIFVHQPEGLQKKWQFCSS